MSEKAKLIITGLVVQLPAEVLMWKELSSLGLPGFDCFIGVLACCFLFTYGDSLAREFRALDNAES